MFQLQCDARRVSEERRHKASHKLERHFVGRRLHACDRWAWRCQCHRLGLPHFHLQTRFTAVLDETQVGIAAAPARRCWTTGYAEKIFFCIQSAFFIRRERNVCQMMADCRRGCAIDLWIISSITTDIVMRGRLCDNISFVGNGIMIGRWGNGFSLIELLLTVGRLNVVRMRWSDITTFRIWKQGNFFWCVLYNFKYDVGRGCGRKSRLMRENCFFFTLKSSMWWWSWVGWWYRILRLSNGSCESDTTQYENKEEWKTNFSLSIFASLSKWSEMQKWKLNKVLCLKRNENRVEYLLL